MSESQATVEFYCGSLDKMRKFSSYLLNEIKDAGWNDIEVDYCDRGDEIEITVFFEGYSPDLKLFWEHGMDCAQLAISLFAEHFQEEHDDKEARPYGPLVTASGWPRMFHSKL